MSIHVVCRMELDDLPERTSTRIPVHLYGARRGNVAAIGNGVRLALQRLERPPSSTALDFVNLALCVVAADTFVQRATAGGDGWARSFVLEVPVGTPHIWAEVAADLASTLQFLTGDAWQLSFRRSQQLTIPKPRLRRRFRTGESDCVVLFSGGLDSFVGALDLLAEGRHPVLVSHAYPGDGAIQDRLRRGLPRQVPHFSANASPMMDGSNETSMRSRSILFIALGTMIAGLLSDQLRRETTLYVPENSFIAVNPPLTPRRVGTLSTRTTHPHFLSTLERTLQSLAVPVRFKNPYQTATKGEMLRNCGAQSVLRELAHSTVSCGKWKRSRLQCGRCVPCVIRRAAFAAAGLPDMTPYASSVVAALSNEGIRDDVLALGLGVRSFGRESELRRAILATGSLESAGDMRGEVVGSVRRGLQELHSYLSSEGLV